MEEESARTAPVTPVPTAAAALTALPGGPMVSALATGAMMKVTSKSAADMAARALVGPKGSGDETTAPADPDAEPPEPDEDKPDDKAGSGSAVSGIAVSLADDFLPVAVRNFSRLPLVGQVGTAVTGTAVAAKSLADHFARFTVPPREADRR